jgi:peptidoglycan hydrolase CwlO-like protein
VPPRMTAILRSALALALLVAVAVPSLPVPALAAPSAGDLASQVMSVRKQLLASRTEMARNLVEYNRLTSELATTHAEVSQLSDKLAELKVSLRKQQRQLNGLAIVRYQTGGLGFLEVIVGARTFDQLVTGMDYIASIAGRTASVVSAVRTARNRTQQVQTALKDRENRLIALRRDLKAQRVKIVAEIAQQQKSMDSLSTQIVQMVNEQ